MDIILLYILYYLNIMDMKLSIFLIILHLLFHHGLHKLHHKEPTLPLQRVGIRRSHRCVDLTRLRQPQPDFILGREGAVASVLSACPCRPPRPAEVSWHELVEPVEEGAWSTSPRIATSSASPRRLAFAGRSPSRVCASLLDFPLWGKSAKADSNILDHFV